MAVNYVADFKDLMRSTHGAVLVNPDSILICRDKFEATAYRAMLDAVGYQHVTIQVADPKKKKRFHGRKHQKPSY